MDPRLVALYDQDNPDGPDHDYFRAVVDGRDARTVVDLGCGTGLLTVTLTRPGRQVIGVDPDSEMLDQARRRPGADQVRWVEGDSGAIGPVDADVVLMSGNVVQEIVGPAWPRTLTDAFAALRPGGTLVFETRNPAAQAWTEWNREATYGTRATPDGPLTEWLEVTAVTEGHVTFEAHNVFQSSGEHLVIRQTLAFRDPAEISNDLEAVGFSVVGLRGGWQGQPVGPGSTLLVVEAVRPVIDR